MSDPEFAVLRRQMIAQIAARTIFRTLRLGKVSLDRRVLEIMGKVPRHDFVRVELRSFAYDDMPLPSGCGKTISQPFIVALMTDLLGLLREEILVALGKHIAVDQDNIVMRMERGATLSTLEIEIMIPHAGIARAAS
jgi:protein-L-isoaspartate(D-aspartate) O-methyltransferase